ncbi:MAG TPA: hypothetical protein VM327_00480 [Candidatus Thermoplasmatota archaeon]|nr:hypothetical protein [Candidatus Thermoplasmatota archaeon]
MHWSSALAALLLLAGCVEAPAAPPPTGQVLHYSVPVKAYIEARGPPVCPAFVSCGGDSHDILATLGSNETAIGFRLNVVTGGNLQGQPFHIEVNCSGAPFCTSPLARHDGLSPFVLASNATLPPSSVLTVDAASFDPTPDPFGTLTPAVFIEGVIFVEALPGPPVPLSERALHLHGIAGACAPLAEANCTSWPAGSTWSYPVEGTLRRINLTATWTATVPASAAMRLTVSCFGVPTCPPPMVAEGGSPLRLDLVPDYIRPGSTLQIEMGWLDLTEVGGFIVPGVPLRQSFAIDGVLTTMDSSILPPDSAFHARCCSR